MIEAMHQKILENGVVSCGLCPHGCVLRNGSSGRCGARKNVEGRLKSMNHGLISSMGFDPVEKKPLYHYKPGRHILSIGSFGCSFDCGFCQNHSIAKGKPELRQLSSKELLERAVELVPEGNIGVAFTYNEPTVWYEYVLECAKLLKSEGLDVVLVTNGFIQEAPLRELVPYVDAMNIDLKGHTEEFYKDQCGGMLAPVKEAIRLASEFCHVELTTLLVPGHNDDEAQLEQLADWVASVSKTMPLHLSRYHPAYRFKEPATPMETMERAFRITRNHLKHVYLGNVWGADTSTYCAECGERLVERRNYETRLYISSPSCPKCDEAINIIL